jgi:hypothetical protein
MNIPAAVWVALVGAAASILAAVFSVYSAVRTARLRSEADLVLERFRVEQENRRRAFEVANHDAEPIIAGLTQVWGDIQAIRNLIEHVVAPAEFDETLALSTFGEAADSLTSGYNRCGGAVPREAAAAWHAAKGRLATIEALIRERGCGARATGGPADVDALLMRIRAALREDQAIIQQATQNVRAELMKGILGAM